MASEHLCSVCKGDFCNDGNFPPMLNMLRKASNEKKVKLMQELCTKTLRIQLAGKDEHMTINNANKFYISQYYPHLKTGAYCWPEVSRFRNDKMPTDIALKKDEFRQQRFGDVAEDGVRGMFESMAHSKQITSFIISSYKWHETFLTEHPILFKQWKSLFGKGKDDLKDGDMDVMVSIPQKFILLIEVKAVDKADNVKKRVCTALLTQCAKYVDFLSVVLADIDECNIPLISVVALPNTSRAIVENLFGDQYPHHFVTEEDLTDIDQLYSWFEQLLSKYTNVIAGSKFSETIYETLIGRLVGPCSIKQAEMVQNPSKETTCRIDNVFNLLTPQQVHFHSQLDQTFVWIRGVPGSGKTSLGYAKAKSIIKGDTQKGAGQTTADSCKNHVLYIINGSSPERDRSCLMQWYMERLGGGSSSCEVFLQESHEMGSYISNLQIPQLIVGLQRRHQNKILHILIEECQMKLEDVDRDDFTTNWGNSVKEDGLGNVWIIQNNFTAEGDSGNSLPNFKLFELNKVLRTSTQNIDFVNNLLRKNYKPGHAITGKHPIVYTMSCICSPTPEDNANLYHCNECYKMRVLCMLRTAIDELGVNTSKEVCSSNAFITSSFLQEEEILKYAKYFDSAYRVQSFNKLPSKEPSIGFYFASSTHHFIGCERACVFLELNCLLQDDFSAMESLTRAVGQMVLLDGGYCRTEDEAKYSRTKKIVQEAELRGLVKIMTMKPVPLEKTVTAFSQYVAVTNFKAKNDAVTSSSSFPGQDASIFKIDKEHLDRMTKAIAPASSLENANLDIALLEKMMGDLLREVERTMDARFTNEISKRFYQRVNEVRDEMKKDVDKMERKLNDHIEATKCAKCIKSEKNAALDH